MIKINLVNKDSRAYKGRNWTRITVLTLFGAIGIYFLGVSLYVVISILVLNNKIASVNEESTAISGTMLKNNEQLSRYVFSKLILTKITDLNRDRFRYKDYLDQISLVLPSGSTLFSVDFTAKGWVSLSISSDDINAFNLFEKAVVEKNVWKDSKYFSGAYIESVTKEKSGSYTTRLQLELLKANG